MQNPVATPKTDNISHLFCGIVDKKKDLREEPF